MSEKTTDSFKQGQGGRSDHRYPSNDNLKAVGNHLVRHETFIQRMLQHALNVARHVNQGAHLE